MHNLISFNQLASWSQTEEEIEHDTNEAINDYFECLTDCDESEQSCRRLCTTEHLIP